jgi:ABC-type branched-subunit amino acid transport system permease subunit
MSADAPPGPATREVCRHAPLLLRWWPRSSSAPVTVWNTLTIFNMGLISAIMALGVNMQWGYAGSSTWA